MKWGELLVREQFRIASIYFKAHSRLSDTDERNIAQQAFTAEAEALSLNQETLTRYCRHLLYWEKQLLGRGALIDDSTLHQETDSQSAGINLYARPAPGPLTDIRTIDLKTDQKLWLEWLHDRAITNPYVVVKHPCDKHMPFHDPRAEQLDLELTRITQPDIMVVGSDAFDFPTLSKFDHDPDVQEGFEDVLELVEFHWKRHINWLRAASPNSIYLWIFGNHDRRLIHWLGQKAPQVRKTVLRMFREIITAQSVWWLGEVDSVRIGPVKVEHGVNHGDNAAKTNLVKSGAQVCKWMGHGHRRQFYHVQGEDYSVVSIMSGHQSLYDENTRTPHYIRGASLKSMYHTLGTAIADVDLSSRDVEFSNLEFKPDGQGQLYTRFERQTIRSIDLERKDGQ